MREYSLVCDCCQESFGVTSSKWKARRSEKKRLGKKIYCSEECRLSARGHLKKQEVCCKLCSKIFFKKNSEIKKTPSNFCSQSCGATYNNQHKTHGTRRSKLEKYLEEELTLLFDGLQIHFNRKDAINSELDIYIPSLKLAFELNGIFHYEPIYGADKLCQIQNNDNRKFQACLERGIELCIIDSSKLSYFKPANAKKYLDIVSNIINQKLVSPSRLPLETPT